VRLSGDSVVTKHTSCLTTEKMQGYVIQYKITSYDCSYVSSMLEASRACCSPLSSSSLLIRVSLVSIREWRLSYSGFCPPRCCHHALYVGSGLRGVVTCFAHFNFQDLVTIPSPVSVVILILSFLTCFRGRETSQTHTYVFLSST
jgi:hypothetical protein